ncbi:hypothetical protein BGZ94_007120 [Podila epigama]|nr:hypothetical protein BGZ94_007120 [Podila epigama]
MKHSCILASFVLATSLLTSQVESFGKGEKITTFFSNEQTLHVIGTIDGLEDTNNNNLGIYSLDFSVSWPASSPAWTNLGVNSECLRHIIAKHIALSKDGRNMYVLSTPDSVQVLDLVQAQWRPDITIRDWKTAPKYIFGGLATDTDTGDIYGIGASPSTGSTYPLFKFDPSSGSFSSESIALPMRTSFIHRTIYSSVRKSLFFLMDDDRSSLYEYHIPTKTLGHVINKGAIPPAFGGTKLMLAGGSAKLTPEEVKKLGRLDTSYIAEYYGQQPLRDVYMFDVATSEWTRMADGPVGYAGAACAVSGDHLVLYGETRLGTSASILNMKDNIWVEAFHPQDDASSSHTHAHWSGAAQHVLPVYGYSQ